ncbi:MAG: ethanolamine ammonia-lyase reactivating factor EutA [Chloroflexi bacterium]|nr:ethanolamine ammonia-lyase reactivating factor EutA [Chloroflexota bacterium]
MANGNGDFEHTHDIISAEDMPAEDDPIWASERIALRSAGIDIGSTTSHLMFSEIVLRRQGMALSSRFQIVKKKVIYESPILITPFLDGNVIDTAGLTKFINSAYREAGIRPEEIDTGAIIVTGEAARKDNAEAIAMMFSAQAGKFVCAAAGHNLEAKMAAYGSGAVEISAVDGGNPHGVMNIDVGGGTTKFGVARNGAVVDTAAINVGARLFVLDETDRIVRIEAPGLLVLDNLGLKLSPGDVMTHEVKHQICHHLARCVVEVVRNTPPSALTSKLMVTPPLAFKEPVRHLIFSGGVSEYIYNHENRDFGDLGRILAEEIRELCLAPGFPHPVHPGAERIRATVIGASQYTVQVSGSTIFLSNSAVLPLRNLQVVAPLLDHSPADAGMISRTILESFRQMDSQPGESPVALAIRWKSGPAYEGLKNLCHGIIDAMTPATARGFPLVLVFDADVGRLVGHIIAQECHVSCDVLSIDGIELQDFDFVDIGELMPDAQVVPVVIKSLVFRS